MHGCDDVFGRWHPGRGVVCADAVGSGQDDGGMGSGTATELLTKGGGTPCCREGITETPRPRFPVSVTCGRLERV